MLLFSYYFVFNPLTLAGTVFQRVQFTLTIHTEPFFRGANLYIVSIIHPLFSINIDYLNGARPNAFEYCHTVTIITPIGYRNLLDKVELFIYMLVACAKPELHSRFFFKSGSRAG